MIDQMNLPSILYELTNNKLSKFYNQTPGTVLDTIGNENAQAYLKMLVLTEKNRRSVSKLKKPNFPYDLVQIKEQCEDYENENEQNFLVNA